MPLSEADLLLLDCFMYSDLAPKSEGKSVAEIIKQFTGKDGNISLDKINKAGLEFSGDMSAEAFKDVLEGMKDSDAIMNLVLTHTTPEYKGSIRAGCFVDKDSGKATVAFRGTGGSYQQWYNNFEGYGELEQDTQRAAREFIESLPYNDIDVTGHSNGGDQAMYVTIVCSDKITRCVSYEGQGVSKEFAEKYADEIARNKVKIKNICGEKDFVSPILIDIAGETVYVPSDADLLGGLLQHGAYGIYTANKETLKKNNGYFPESAYVEQAWYCKGIQDVTTFLSEHSDTPFVGPALELTADVIGIVVGFIISGNALDLLLHHRVDPEVLLKACADLVIALKDFAVDIIKDGIEAIQYVCKKVVEWAEKHLNKGAKYAQANPQIVVDTYKLKTYAQRILKVQKRIKNLDERLDSLYWKVGFLDLWDLMQADLLTGYSWRLARCANYLSDTASDFDGVEKDLQNKLG